ncbi:hypothetical protein [Variovorax sp. EL159]|uniref:hypothetical protein n=1 Tax=Variovorax sp. EL159 TaxID=1566270 RepID=UPI00088E01BE|nr:hypothetical protein [Variovorax sp. EL159]SCX74178.1 hypothetical protein SAMN03159363_5919 [Variovorax sp. EL159]
MSVLHMFLPACEPARSEVLAQFIKTHHVPRHLVKGIARRNRSDPEPTDSAGALQEQQQAPSQAAQVAAAPE